MYETVRNIRGFLTELTDLASILHILTYLLTPWCRVLLGKLTGLQLVKKFPAFHRTRRFITALTSVHHLSLSWASTIQSIYPHPTSWRSILILSTHLFLWILFIIQIFKGVRLLGSRLCFHLQVKWKKST